MSDKEPLHHEMRRFFLSLLANIDKKYIYIKNIAQKIWFCANKGVSLHKLLNFVQCKTRRALMLIYKKAS